MQRQQLEQAIARATGESLRTIRERGFGLVLPRLRRVCASRARVPWPRIASLRPKSRLAGQEA